MLTMKKIIFIFLICFSSYSQEDDTCKKLSIYILNDVHRNEPSFNAYLKDNNSCLDIEYKIEANYQEYLKMKKTADNIFIEDCKSSMFNVLKTMVNTGFFKNSDINACTFDEIIFNMTFITSDKQRIPFHFMFKFVDINNIKDRLNREEAMSFLNYLGSN
jgi:hypothetical protein